MTAPLRRGWTTGACAAAAAKACVTRLVSGTFPDPVTITLPGGQTPAFALATAEARDNGATATVVKDAGDDPDVTHGALIIVTVEPAPALTFAAGEGVGTVTRPGLPLPVGEPAINPVPRAMIAKAIADVTDRVGWRVTIGVENGRALAEKTLNGRLGIVGGLSILGTTGIVIPYSCAAWIHSIHRGIDVARASGLNHIAGATGSTSEAAVAALHGLEPIQLVEMGDFVGGMLKYLRTNPVPRVTVAGGVAKMTKLAEGRLDLHSKRGRADMAALARHVADPQLAASVAGANTVAEAFALADAAGAPLGEAIAAGAWRTAAAVLGNETLLEIAVFDRTGRLVGRTPFQRSADNL